MAPLILGFGALLLAGALAYALGKLPRLPENEGDDL